MQQTSNIDIKGLFLYLIKKAFVILLVGILISGIVFFCSCFFVANKSNDEENIVFDLSVRLPDESDIEYAERVRNINRSNDLIKCIEVLYNQLENHRKYVTDSIFMKINAENEAVSTVNLTITADSSNTNKSELALASAYKQYVLSGEYLNELEDYKENKGYITELIKANYENTVVVNNSSDTANMIVLTITVIGPTTDFTDMIMDTLLNNVEIEYSELNKSVAMHSINIVERQSSYMVDSSTRDKQMSLTYRFESLQQQISSYDSALDNVASSLGLEKARLYDYFSNNDNVLVNNTNNVDNKTGSRVKTSVKYSILSFALYFVVLVFVLVMKYLYSMKFTTQSRFFCRFPGVLCIGVVKPTSKRTKFSKCIDIHSGDDNKLSLENSNKLLSANVRNLTSGMDKVLVTGTADNSRIKNLVKDLGIKADVKDSFFIDPSTLGILSEYDGVIIIEQRDYSDCKDIAEEISLISNAHTHLIGAIIL